MAKILTFKSIFGLLNNKRNKVYVKLQYFKKPFVSNYGEIPKYINNADKDPWDVIVPGYPRLETSKQFRIKELIGIYKLPDGNHKLIIDIYDTLYQDKNKIRKEIDMFKKKYEQKTKLVGQIIYF